MPISETDNEQSSLDKKRELIISIQGFQCDHWNPSRIAELFDNCPSDTFIHKMIRAHVYLCHPDQI